MGKPNIAVNHWLSDNSRFADLFNGIVFGGEQIVRPEELEPMDREADILITDKEGREKGVQRYRDIVKRWRQGMDLAVLACESQRKVHYAMPIRNMLYDSLSYAEQARILWKERKKKQPAEGPLTGEEYLSRFGKKDTLFPVITVVFYYGLESGSVEELERFRTDLQPILGMLKYRGRKEELRDYIYQNRAYFGHVDKATYRAVGELLHSKKVWNQVAEAEKEGEIDMCQALEELYADGGLFAVAERLREGGFSAEEIKKYTGLEEQEIQRLGNR